MWGNYSFAERKLREELKVNTWEALKNVYHCCIIQVECQSIWTTSISNTMVEIISYNLSVDASTSIPLRVKSCYNVNVNTRLIHAKSRIVNATPVIQIQTGSVIHFIRFTCLNYYWYFPTSSTLIWNVFVLKLRSLTCVVITVFPCEGQDETDHCSLQHLHNSSLLHLCSYPSQCVASYRY
jgi:hypothetical protein